MGLFRKKKDKDGFDLRAFERDTDKARLGAEADQLDAEAVWALGQAARGRTLSPEYFEILEQRLQAKTKEINDKFGRPPDSEPPRFHAMDGLGKSNRRGQNLSNDGWTL